LTTVYRGSEFGQLRVVENDSQVVVLHMWVTSVVPLYTILL
jgi:hypothetical protein